MTNPNRDRDDEWLERAACRAEHVDPEWFFSTDKLERRWALEICGGCPVTLECLADDVDGLGIRGGLDLEENRRIARNARQRARRVRGGA